MWNSPMQIPWNPEIIWDKVQMARYRVSIIPSSLNNYGKYRGQTLGDAELGGGQIRSFQIA